MGWRGRPGDPPESPGEMPGNKHRRPGQLTGAAMSSRRLGRAPGGGGLPADAGPPGGGGLVSGRWAASRDLVLSRCGAVVGESAGGFCVSWLGAPGGRPAFS
jgi:hypothetical protein